MNENVKSIIDKVKTDSSNKWVSVDKLEDLVYDVVKECVAQIENSNYRHCALTTHDLSVADCAKEKIQNHLKIYFNVKSTFGEFQ